jgi:hypothetical protein
MTKNILIFIFGAVVGILMRESMIAYLSRPQDITASCPPEIRKKLNSPDMAFMKRSRILPVGPFVVVLPGEKGQSLLAHFSIKESPYFPMVDILDDNANGIPDNLMVTDPSGHMLNLYDKNEDGTWDRYSYSNNIGTKDACSFVDFDMDGTFEGRFKLN